MNPMIQNPKLVPGGPFRVGDRVSFLFGAGKVEGVIVEDRGPLGIGGGRIYGVQVRRDEWNEMTTEVPAEDLQAVAG